MLGSGTIAGIGFTAALLIADRAFHGQQLAEARLGALTAALVAALLTDVHLGAQLAAEAAEAAGAQDVESADLSGVSGTPTFFVNGQRHYGAFDLDTLSNAIKTARAAALTAA